MMAAISMALTAICALVSIGGIVYSERHRLRPLTYAWVGAVLGNLGWLAYLIWRAGK